MGSSRIPALKASLFLIEGSVFQLHGVFEKSGAESML